MSTEVKKSLVNLERRQQFLYIGIFSLVTIMIWVSVSLLLSQKTSQLKPELKKKALPLTPTINQQVIGRLEQKRSYTSEELSSFEIFKLIISRDGTEEVVTIDTPDPRTQPLPTPEPETEPELTLDPTAEPNIPTEPSSTEPSTLETEPAASASANPSV